MSSRTRRSPSPRLRSAVPLAPRRRCPRSPRLFRHHGRRRACRRARRPSRPSPSQHRWLHACLRASRPPASRRGLPPPLLRRPRRALFRVAHPPRLFRRGHLVPPCSRLPASARAPSVLPRFPRSPPTSASTRTRRRRRGRDVSSRSRRNPIAQSWWSGDVKTRRAGGHIGLRKGGGGGSKLPRSAHGVLTAADGLAVWDGVLHGANDSGLWRAPMRELRPPWSSWTLRCADVEGLDGSDSWTAVA